jgi:WD40 repeat protein
MPPPSRRLAFISGDKSIFIFQYGEPAPGVRRFSLAGSCIGHKKKVHCLSFHPSDPNILVSGGGDGLFVWDVTKFSRIHTINPTTRGEIAHDSDVECIAWTHGGVTLLSGGKDCEIKCWDALDGSYRHLETITGHKAPVLSISYNEATQRFASAGRDSTVKLWSAVTLSKERRAKRHDDKAGETVHLDGNMDGQRGDICCLSWFKNGKFLVAGGRDNSIMIYDAVKIAPHRLVKIDLRSARHMGDIRSLVVVEQTPAGQISPNYFLMSCSLDSTYKVWHLNITDALIEETKDEAAMAVDAKARDEAILASLLSDKPIAESHTAEVSDNLLLTREMHAPHGVWGMAVNGPLQLMATASAESAVTIRDIRNMLEPVPIQDFIGHTEAVNACAMLVSRIFCPNL